LVGQVDLVRVGVFVPFRNIDTGGLRAVGFGHRIEDIDRYVITVATALETRVTFGDGTLHVFADDRIWLDGLDDAAFGSAAGDGAFHGLVDYRIRAGYRTRVDGLVDRT
jgi:hypothetical protein